MEAKKTFSDKNFTFSFAHAEMRKRVFLNFLRYLRTDFEAVTEYVFGMIVRLYVVLIFSFTLAETCWRKCAKEFFRFISGIYQRI